MGRFLAGVASTLLMVAAGIVIWRSQADAVPLIPPAPSATTGRLSLADIAPPLEASEKTREEKRFSRYDRDRNGAVGRDEYLLNRQKSYARLDVNGDGKLSFDEYSTKAIAKFAAADRDKSGVLNAVEFSATRVVRKDKPKPNCPPPLKPRDDDEG
jgi:hypothetical protein